MEPISKVSSILDAGMCSISGLLLALLMPRPARELTIEAGALSSARKSSTRVLPAAQLKKLLDSKHERDVLEGLRRVIAVMHPLLDPPRAYQHTMLKACRYAGQF